VWSGVQPASQPTDTLIMLVRWLLFMVSDPPPGGEGGGRLIRPDPREIYSPVKNKTFDKYFLPPIFGTLETPNPSEVVPPTPNPGWMGLGDAPALMRLSPGAVSYALCVCCAAVGHNHD